MQSLSELIEGWVCEIRRYMRQLQEYLFFSPPEFHATHSFINVGESYILPTQLLYNSFRNISNNITDYAFIDIELIHNRHVIVFLNDMIQEYSEMMFRRNCRTKMRLLLLNMWL